MMSGNRLFARGRRPEESQWISVSDLMAGLMVIFLFVAIAHMRVLDERRERIGNIIHQWEKSENEIQVELEREFAVRPQDWEVVVDENEPLLVRFAMANQGVLFEPQKFQLTPQFEAILSDFCPRYINLLQPYKEIIKEIRIEGHASSEWDGLSPDEVYFQNMELSQNRARTVLRYCLGLGAVQKDKRWAIQLITSNGLSFSRLEEKSDGREDPDASRRVEFRILTDIRELKVDLQDAIR